MSGFFLVWRDVLEVEAFKEGPFCPGFAWVWLMAKANHGEKMDRYGEIIKRGELHTSQHALAAAWGWDRSKVQRFLSRLEREQRIEQETNKLRTKIRLINYELYQPVRHHAEQPANNQPNKEPNKQAIITETTPKQISKGEGEQTTLSLQIEVSKDDLAGLVSEFGQPCLDWYVSFCSKDLKAKGRKKTNAGPWLQKWILQDQMEKRNWFSAAAQKERAKNGQHAEREKQQRAESRRRIVEMTAPVSEPDPVAARKLLEKAFPGITR